DATEDAAETAEETVTTEAARQNTLLDSLLTSDGFDAAEVLNLVQTSDLDAGAKAALAQLIEQAQDNPALLEQALQTLRDQLSQ
ncbi:MAG: hypothetical protein AAF841_14560, partial [Pseudomonadota bacterium]